MAYTTIDDPEAYFQVKTYTGNSDHYETGDSQAITFDGDEDMSPDLVWIKSRTQGGTGYNGNHVVFDSVRGTTKRIAPSTTEAELTQSGVTAFGSDGFTVGPYDMMNSDGDAFVAYCWKESATAGFDILTYTGNATNRTIAHNLSAVPQVVIVKRRDAVTAWSSLHLNGVGSDYRMVLNDTAAKEDDATFWQDTDPTSSVFSLGTSSSTNVNTGTYVAYCFAEKQGYSKFGNYTGNGNADGAFVYTGFRPAYVMIKRTDSANSWMIYDAKRNPINLADNPLYAEGNDAEGTSSAASLDFLSNGFKLRGTGSAINASGASMIYMCFAEAPFVNSNGVPCNAR